MRCPILTCLFPTHEAWDHMTLKHEKHTPHFLTVQSAINHRSLRLISSALARHTTARLTSQWYARPKKNTDWKQGHEHERERERSSNANLLLWDEITDTDKSTDCSVRHKSKSHRALIFYPTQHKQHWLFTVTKRTRLIPRWRPRACIHLENAMR